MKGVWFKKRTGTPSKVDKFPSQRREHFNATPFHELNIFYMCILIKIFRQFGLLILFLFIPFDI